MLLKIYYIYKRIMNSIAFYKVKGAKIGKDCDISVQSYFGSEPYLIQIGNHVRINRGVHLVTHDGGVWVLRKKYKELKNIDLFGMIKIGDNCHIGTNAIIMPGTNIGKNCIIGCGAIVTKDIPDNSIAVGVPAKVIENIDEYFSKHKNDFDYTKHLSKDEKQKYLIEKYKEYI